MRSAALFAAAIACAALALPATAEWQQLKRDTNSMLSIDPVSVKRDGDLVSFRYLLDFRLAQGDAKTSYKSIVASAKVNCKERTMSLVHTDAYARFGAQGIIVAKTRDTPQETAFKPLVKATSDEELAAFVCEGKTPPQAPPSKLAPAPAPAAPAASMKK